MAKTHLPHSHTDLHGHTDLHLHYKPPTPTKTQKNLATSNKTYKHESQTQNPRPMATPISTAKPISIATTHHNENP